MCKIIGSDIIYCQYKTIIKKNKYKSNKNKLGLKYCRKYTTAILLELLT